MTQLNMILKRIFMYIFGLFVMSLGVSFSIEADLGVSPVSSLAYAVALTSGFTVGSMTIAVNCLYIIIQIILSKRFQIKATIMQISISLLFGLSIDGTLYLIQHLPTPKLLISQTLFLIISLFIIAIGLLFYIQARFPLMPYDELTHIISERFNMEFGKAKIVSDLLNVSLAGGICLVFINSLGSIGIGTVIAAYFIGKIVGGLMKVYKKYLATKDSARI